MDDAFRMGDYIIVGSARGQVEAISVRSFKLRHHLGPLYTIPFGSVKNIQNMTRDWAIMKLQYLVPFDTDIGQVKKIIKKINKEIRSVPELNELCWTTSRVRRQAMEEYGMRMRVKFMTKPGGQFTLRKLVLAKMRKEFAEAGSNCQAACFGSHAQFGRTDTGRRGTSGRSREQGCGKKED